jgi:hypothetical protein
LPLPPLFHLLFLLHLASDANASLVRIYDY